MTEPSELASLIADTLAVLESLRRQGVDVLPVGLLNGLGPAPEGGPGPVRPESPPSAPVRAPPPAGGPGPRPAVRDPSPVLAPRPVLRDPSPVPAATPRLPDRQPALVASPPPAPGAPADADSAAGLFGSKWSRVAESPDVALASLRREISACTACTRCERRRQALPGEGPARPLLLIVTDPPDAEADACGQVLYGDAAIMLERMLLNVVRVDRREVQILPVVRCASPKPLQPADVAACRGFLARQITLSRPRAVLVLGEQARIALGLDRHGAWGEVHGVAALSTFHPLWLLANPGDKKATLGHLQELARKVG